MSILKFASQKRYKNTQADFADFRLSRDIVAGLNKNHHITRPTEIQALALDELIDASEKNYVISSQTGTGKTLAYLLPIFQELKSQERELAYAPQPNQPRALILLPYKELGEQVSMVAKELAHVARLRVRSVLKGRRYKAQKEGLDLVDVLIGTPGKVMQHAAQGNVKLNNLKFFVLDESDGVFLENFMNDKGIKEFLRKVSKADVNTYISSIWNDKLQDKLTAWVHPQPLKVIKTGLVNRKKNKLHTEFVYTPGPQDKIDNLLRLLDKLQPANEHEDVRLLIFTNKTNTCQWLEHTLKENGFKNAVSIHKGVGVKQRLLRWRNLLELREKQATKPGSETDGEDREVARKNRVNIFLGTDSLARGVDAKGIDNILLFDFPLNPLDFLHKVGRTARAGKSGTVVSFVKKGDLVLAEAIKKASKYNMPLHDLTGNRAEMDKHFAGSHASEEAHTITERRSV